VKEPPVSYTPPTSKKEISTVVESSPRDLYSVPEIKQTPHISTMSPKNETSQSPRSVPERVPPPGAKKENRPDSPKILFLTEKHSVASAPINSPARPPPPPPKFPDIKTPPPPPSAAAPLSPPAKENNPQPSTTTTAQPIKFLNLPETPAKKHSISEDNKPLHSLADASSLRDVLHHGPVEASSKDDERALQANIAAIENPLAKEKGSALAAFPTLQEGEDVESEDEETSNKESPLYHTAGASFIDWNEEFQRISALEDSAEKYKQLSQIAHEFVYVAETYGRVIISELYLPDDRKSIKPVNLGGRAGGSKYIVHNILFKFALDLFGLYGNSDENAQKAAGHDLKGLIHYWGAGVSRLHFPLMALIHYMGHCLIAMSILPLGANSLKYGSNDGGKTLHFDDPVAVEKMKEAGQRLNLKGHRVGQNTQLIYGPGDIECHLGEDGRYYVLDFARTFPPEAVLAGGTRVKGQTFFKLLRPELVINYPTPLSSDAFSGFTQFDPDSYQNNLDVYGATKKMITVLIPRFVETLKSLTSESQYTISCSMLISELHKQGINVRHLGHVRRLLGIPYGVGVAPHIKHLSRLLLVEMVARVVKSQIRLAWRQKAKTARYITDLQCKQVATEILNLVFSQSKQSKEYWVKQIKPALKEKFVYSLFSTEESNNFDIWAENDLGNKNAALLPRIQELTGIVISLSSSSLNEPLTFLVNDITTIETKVKYMPIIEIADVQVLLYEALSKEGSEADRLFTALSNRALQRLPMPHLYLAQADSLLKSGRAIRRLLKTLPKSQVTLENTSYRVRMNVAAECFSLVTRIKPDDPHAFIEWGKLLMQGGSLHTAKEKFEQALKRGISNVKALTAYAKFFFVEHTKDLNAEEIGIQAIRNAIAVEPQNAKCYFLYGNYLLQLLSRQKAVTSQEKENLKKEAIEAYEKGFGINPNAMKPTKKFWLRVMTSSEFPTFLRLLVLELLQRPLFKDVSAELFPKITHWEVSNFVNITDSHIQFLAERCSNIEKFVLINCPRVSDRAIQLLLKANAAKLKHVVLQEQATPSKDTFLQLSRCPKLEALRIEKCGEFPVQSLLTVLKSTKIKELYVPGLKDMSPTNCEALLSVQQFQRLNISSTSLDASVMLPLQLQKGLTHLYLGAVKDLSMPSVQGLLFALQYLVVLDLKGCAISENEFLGGIGATTHQTLQVVVSPRGNTLLFSGDAATEWKWNTSGSTIESIVLQLQHPENKDPEYVTTLEYKPQIGGLVDPKSQVATISSKTAKINIKIQRNVQTLTTEFFCGDQDTLYATVTEQHVKDNVQLEISFCNLTKRMLYSELMKNEKLFGGSIQGPDTIVIAPGNNVSLLLPILFTLRNIIK